MPETDLNLLAASLAATAVSLEEHIERRAQQIAEPRILSARLDAKNRIDKQQQDAEADRRRRDDLIAELRRQLNAQVKQNERLNREVNETRAAIRRVEALKVWTNEDRKKFVFADDLWEALAETGSPAARALAELTQRRASDA